MHTLSQTCLWTVFISIAATANGVHVRVVGNSLSLLACSRRSVLVASAACLGGCGRSIFPSFDTGSDVSSDGTDTQTDSSVLETSPPTNDVSTLETIAPDTRTVCTMFARDLPEGHVRAAMFEGTLVFVARDAQGIFALSSLCTHAGCALNVDRNESTLLCPCHGSAFGLHGEVLVGPARASLSFLAVERSADDCIIVHPSTIVTSEARV